MDSSTTTQPDSPSIIQQVEAFIFAVVFGISGLLTGLIIALIGIFVIALIVGPHTLSSIQFLYSGILQEIGYALFPIALIAWRPSILPRTLRGLFKPPTKRHLLWMVGGILVMLGGNYAAAIIRSVLHAPSAPNSAAVQASQHASVLVFVVLIAEALFVIGPCEELLFRGLIQTYLREYFHPAVAVILTSALFASAHAIAVSGSLSGVRNTLISLFVLSLVLGASRERTDSLLVSMVIHGVYDAVLFGILGFSTLH